MTSTVVTQGTSDRAAPEIDGIWVRPSHEIPAQPVWGHAEGLRVGLWPLSGPRGLLRIYTPYLGHESSRMINYIAVEPVLTGQIARSFSEMEDSMLDLGQGLRFWSADSPGDFAPRDPTTPARGVITREGNVEILTVYILIEPYRSGAAVYVRLRFRSDRPYEVGIATHTRPGSADLAACILTATMGNYARLRTLHLAEQTVQAGELWPVFSGDGFARHRWFSLDELIRTPNGGALFVATPNEPNPADAEYEVGTPWDWRYTGQVATQYWRHEDPLFQLRASVNGRTIYWGTESAIPGGVAFENFELIELFREGAEFWFGVVPGI
ncbi:hypothetical protein JW848_03705 [Candidatus Bipolaricaulota bacterium]|nr:hypothetical protein [Candidatus Bipolaricaulota bacterium]